MVASPPSNEFQSTLSVRRATDYLTFSGFVDEFQSTLSVRRATIALYASPRDW
ncbi:hypothetical protein BIFADO_02339 [Bifidobacterium adolescentis L2-32]|uniref:Uncharacterized protein n=1 Tax=Bifidobacterium adolescentis L2-32 TaxID=411481 RepID=A7A8Z6_BIFAD|nr:hypothetical protein BIFADO_02339 [Bifidobacterium adolescentis L2-32]